MLILIILLSFFGVAKYNYAPNRPSQSNSPWVVPVNALMIETGINYSNNSNIEDATLGVIELRYGIFAKDEIKLGFAFNNNINSEKFDITALSLNYKRELIDSYGIIPSMSALVSGIIPNLTADNIDFTPGLRFIFRNTFDDITISYNLGYVYFKDNSDLAYTLNFGYNISNKLAVFAEVYGNSNEFRNYYTSNAVDLGANYMLNDNLQVDFHFGKDISTSDDFYFINFGGAYLIRN